MPLLESPLVVSGIITGIIGLVKGNTLLIILGLILLVPALLGITAFSALFGSIPWYIWTVGLLLIIYKFMGDKK